jgi:hypothetical protein
MLGSSPALAQTDPSQLAPPQENDDGTFSPYALTFKLESDVGQGAFVANENARNAYVGWLASIIPAYRPIRPLTLSVVLRVAQELTDSDSDTSAQQLLLDDVIVRAGYQSGMIPVVDIDTRIIGSLYLPTSLASQYQTLVTGLGVSGLFSRSFFEGHFSLDYMATFRKNFHRYESPAVSLEDDGTPPIYARAGGAEDLGGDLVSVGTNNASFVIRNELSATYSPIQDKLSFTLSYELANSFTYASFDKDELSSPYADEGVGQRDATVAMIAAGYRLDKRFSFAAGFATAATPKSADNQSFRFPFWDFESTADNLSVFFIEATVNEPFGE